MVNEEALTHAVSQLRRVFGDEPKRPRFIQTIHKTGYRLVQPVEWLGAEEPDRRWAGARGAGAHRAGSHRADRHEPRRPDCVRGRGAGCVSRGGCAGYGGQWRLQSRACPTARFQDQSGPGVHRPCAGSAGGLGDGHPSPFPAVGSAQAGGAGRRPLHQPIPAERPIRRSPRTARGSPSPGGSRRAATTTSTSSSAIPRRRCGLPPPRVTSATRCGHRTARRSPTGSSEAAK